MSDLQASMARAGQLQEVLRFMSTPRTIEEVAEEFDWHPQTAREKIWELRDMGKVQEMPRKRSRSKVWQATALTGNLGEMGYAVVTTNGTFPLKNFTQNSHGNRKALGDVLAGALCYLWRRAYYQMQDQDNVLNVAPQGSLDPLFDVRKGLEQVFLTHLAYMDVLRKMLTEMPELWQDNNPIVLEMLGKVSREEIEGNVGDFEVWLRTAVLGQ